MFTSIFATPPTSKFRARWRDLKNAIAQAQKKTLSK